MILLLRFSERTVFIGSRLVEFLHLGGAATYAPLCAVPPRRRCPRFGLDGRVADARDEALASAFEGCDHVVHAVAGRPIIVGAIEPVYRAADAAGVRRLVYLSSASVHGQSPRPEPTRPAH